jgi:N-methylhydantoinase B
MGAVRLLELVDRYGLDMVTATMAALQDYSETRMRAAIALVPDGVYCGEDAVDDDGDSDTPLAVRSKVTVTGDSIAIDFAGTAPQVRKNLNSPFASTVSAALSCIKAALTSPDIPFNAGAARPITVTAPKGSLLNPHPPAPVRARMEACSRAWNATMKALAQAVPEKVMACGFDTTTALVLSRLENNSWSVCLEICGGGFGATAERDGCDAVDPPLSNCSNTPIEALDQDFGFFRVMEYALRADSCGPGRMRGGLGFVRRYEILEEGVQVALYSDRFRRAPEGLFGGGTGTTGFCQIRRGDHTIDLRSKDSFALSKGDLLTIALGGGGGYGDPAARCAERIRSDADQGFISVPMANRWQASQGEILGRSGVSV